MFVKGSFRVILNVHSLNTEGAVGNYNPLVKVYVIRRTEGGFDLAEVNAISGNMLKHWHAKHVAELAKTVNEKLCEDCRRGVFYRTRLETKATSEENMIKECVLDDLHGFLCARTTVRRESLIKVSFAIPVEEHSYEVVPVTHNRVVIDEKGKIAKEGMMPFKNEYASGVYAFAISMELKYVGIPLANPIKPVIEEESIRQRRILAVQALANMLLGETGAKLSRALPISKPIEAFIVVSEKPIPAPVHAYYTDYAIESLKMYEGLVDGGLLGKEDFEIHLYPKTLAEEFVSEKITVKRHESIGELLKAIIQKVG